MHLVASKLQSPFMPFRLMASAGAAVGGYIVCFDYAKHRFGLAVALVPSSSSF
jgi:hypothetical protein